MRYVSLLVVMAIVLYAYGKHFGGDSSKPVNEAMEEFQKTAGSAAPKTPTSQNPSTPNLRRPIDTTRAVLEKVKQQNAEGGL